MMPSPSWGIGLFEELSGSDGLSHGQEIPNILSPQVDKYGRVPEIAMPQMPLYQKLIDILLEMNRARGSAVIRLEAGKSKKQLVIRAGRLAFAESNDPGEHLARILINMKVINRADLTKIAAAMKAGNSSDEAIFNICAISGGELEKGGREQADTILASLYGWGEYRLQLYSGEAFGDRRINLQIQLPEMIVAAARRAASEGLVPASFSSAELSVAPADQLKPDLLQLPLQSSECYALSLITGPTKVRDLLPLLVAAEAAPVKVIHRLLLLGMIRIEETVVETGAQAAEAVASSAISEGIDALLQKFEVASLYEMLSVPTAATADQIKTAYHEMARQYHPDRFQSAEFSPELRSRVGKLFTYVTGAYTTLSDLSARASYDEIRVKQESPIEAARQAKVTPDSDREKMAEALFRAARSSLAKMEFDKAVSHLRECVHLCPDVHKYHHHLGVAQSQIPRLRKDAERHLLRAIELNGSSTESYLALGKLYVKVNLARRAQAQFEEALRWDPMNAEASKMLETLAEHAGTN
jgi:curved DNA-binding protein CbpA